MTTPVTPSSVCDMQERFERILGHAEFDDGKGNKDEGTLRGQLLFIADEARAALAERTQQEAMTDEQIYDVLDSLDMEWWDVPSDGTVEFARAILAARPTSAAECTAPMQPSEAVAYLLTRPSGFQWTAMPKDITPDTRAVHESDGVRIEALALAAPTQAPMQPSLADIIAAVPDIGDKAARESTIARMAFRAGLDAAPTQAGGEAVDHIGEPLNKAGWAFINALPAGAHLNGHAFNNIKPAMKAAIEAYLAAAPAAEVQAAGGDAERDALRLIIERLEPSPGYAIGLADEVRRIANEGLSAHRQEHDEVQSLRELAATCYAGLGTECNLPEAWLDALLAASNGEPFSTDGLLPYSAAPAAAVACNGTNCHAVNGVGHSAECEAEHEAAINAERPLFDKNFPDQGYVSDAEWKQRAAAVEPSAAPARTPLTDTVEIHIPKYLDRDKSDKLVDAVCHAITKHDIEFKCVKLIHPMPGIGSDA